MNIVTDQELLLFHYRDGLSAGRVREIEHVLFFDAELRLRLAALRETLAGIDEAWPETGADACLESRLWDRIEPQIVVPKARPRWRDRMLGWIEPLRPAPVAFASLLLATLGVGYLLGQRDASVPAAPAPSLMAQDASARVLASYLASHLQDTERALLVASNSPDDAEMASQLAIELLDSHRLYALAAERAGKPALARFLRELEPVLIELANEEGAIAPALGEEIRQRDLAYKSRAAAALARGEFPDASHSL
jgi:anti-sigma-K factor RskA